MATEVDTEVGEDLFRSGEQDLDSKNIENSDGKEISELILDEVQEALISPVDQTLTTNDTTPTESAQTHNKKRSFDSAFHIDGGEVERPLQKQRTESQLQTPANVPGTGRIRFEVNIKATMHFSLEKSQVEDEASGRWRNEVKGVKEIEG